MKVAAAPAIVTLTLNPCIDANAEVDRVLPDRKLRCGPPRYEPGGGGVNVARAVRRLGGRALAVYPAGGGEGAMLRALLEREGVPQIVLPIAGSTRENLNVFEESTGRQYRFVLPGPELTALEVESCYRALEGLSPFPAYLVASGSLPPGVPADFFARVARLVRARGARFVLDTPGEAAAKALEEGLFLFKPSLREFQDLTRLDGSKEDGLATEASRWIRLGRCEAVVVSLGAAGALVVTAGACERIPAPTVPVRSTVGAGDSLLAGLVMRLQEGRPLSEAARFGVAAGAAAVLNPGTELCYRADAERLFAGMVSSGAASLQPA